MSTTHRRVTLIQCTDSKRDSPALARHLYDESRYYRRMRAWADALGRPWYILSAKHGLVHPGQILSPYDDRGLSADQAGEIARQLHAVGVRTADVTAGRDYTDPLIPALEQRGIEVINHFSGLTIGKRERRLKMEVRRLSHDT